LFKAKLLYVGWSNKRLDELNARNNCGERGGTVKKINLKV